MPPNTQSPLLNWFLDPASGPAVAALSFAVGVVGFAITIWQLWRTRTAVETANRATAALRSRLTRQNAAIQVANAQALVKVSQRDLKTQDWTALLEALESLRTILVILHRRPELLEREAHAALPELLKDLADYCSYLERRAPNVTDMQRTKMAKRLRDLSSLLTNLADHLLETTQ